MALCLAAPAAGQSGPLPARTIVQPAPLVYADPPAEQLAQLQRWTRDYTEWEEWFLRWRSRPQPGLWSSKPRRTPPVPPAWLPAACASLLEDSGPFVDACAAWREWSSGDEGAGLVKQQLAQARSAHETPRNSAWWEHVHVDGLWPMTQTGSQAFGLAGMHTTVNVTRRFEVFLTPGAILMRVPAMTGGMTWSAGTDWGFSYRLFDFRMPAMHRASTVHFNMVRVWMLSGHAVQTPGEMYLAGFSLTFKRR